VAPRNTNGPRPWRLLTALAMIIVIMLISITGADTFHPGQWHQQFKVRLGLDLSSGTQVVLQAQTPKGHPPSSSEMNQAWSILQARVNGTGTTGAQVQQQGGDLLNVSVPGAGSQQVIALVSTTAQMRFRQVLLFQPHSSRVNAPAAGHYGNASLVNSRTRKLFGQLVCTPGRHGDVDDAWKATAGYSPQRAQWDDVGSQIVSCDAAGNKYALDKAVFKGTDVTSENAGLLPGSTAWAVTITLDGAAAKAFGALTTKQYNDYWPEASTNEDDAVLDQTALVLDGDVVAAPQTHTVLTTGEFQITGPGSAPFTQQQATRLVNELRYGALPLSFKQLSVTSISAQLGPGSLHAGLIAATIGLGLVAAYSFVYYRGLGAVSVSSLVIAALLAYLAVVLLSRYQNFTLNLSGIAGLVVAIGITADSFVVFFERLRDEVRDGRTLRAAVEHGWKRARRTILVSDTVSFLAAVVFYHFALGDVQGFAYALGLTTVIDVLVVFGFTKPAATLLAGTKFYGGGHRWSGLDPARLGARAPGRSRRQAGHG
jgi:preprotein translocase subunit SecD